MRRKNARILVEVTRDLAAEAAGSAFMDENGVFGRPDHCRCHGEKRPGQEGLEITRKAFREMLTAFGSLAPDERQS